MIKTELKKFISNICNLMDYMDSVSSKRSLYDQCFGAVAFAVQMANDKTLEKELMDMWYGDWKEKLEEKVYA